MQDQEMRPLLELDTVHYEPPPVREATDTCVVCGVLFMAVLVFGGLAVLVI